MSAEICVILLVASLISLDVHLIRLRTFLIELLFGTSLYQPCYSFIHYCYIAIQYGIVFGSIPS